MNGSGKTTEEWRIAIHPTQLALLKLIDGKDYEDGLSLRGMAKKIGIDTSPQKIKFHLRQLIKYGFVNIVGGKFRPNKSLFTHGK